MGTSIEIKKSKYELTPVQLLLFHSLMVMMSGIWP